MPSNGPDPDPALRRARSRALVVGAGSTGARADEARPSPPSVSRQVRASAGRGAARALRTTGGRVLDPFAGSGTTLVQALESGYDAVGVDIAAFNALLVSVKTLDHDLESLDADVHDVGKRLAASTERPTGFVAEWFAPQAAAELLHFRSLIAEYASQDVLRVVLARAARSARLTTHFDLDFPRAPQLGEYWCHKHRRTCRPGRERGKVPLPLPDRHGCADPGVRRGARSEAGCARAARRRAGARARRAVRRGRHLTAVSRPDRLSRAAPLRLRAARPRRPARAGTWRRRAAGRARQRSRST